MESSLYDNIFEVERSHWWYRARRDIIFFWLEKLIKSNPNIKILDIGCGTGYNLYQIKGMGVTNTFGLDISLKALRYSRERDLDRLFSADLSALPVQDKSIDVVLALDILEHIDNDFNALHEIHRTLAPEGNLIIFVPAFSFLWGLQDEISHHYRRYTIRELKKILGTVGFKTLKISYLNTILFPLIFIGRFLYRLNNNIYKVDSESQLTPTWMNRILYSIFYSELSLLKFINLPFGVSILVICKKADSND